MAVIVGIGAAVVVAAEGEVGGTEAIVVDIGGGGEGVSAGVDTAGVVAERDGVGVAGAADGAQLATAIASASQQTIEQTNFSLVSFTLDLLMRRYGNFIPVINGYREHLQSLYIRLGKHIALGTAIKWRGWRVCQDHFLNVLVLLKAH